MQSILFFDIIKMLILLIYDWTMGMNMNIASEDPWSMDLIIKSVKGILHSKNDYYRRRIQNRMKVLNYVYLSTVRVRMTVEMHTTMPFLNCTQCWVSSAVTNTEKRMKKKMKERKKEYKTTIIDSSRIETTMHNNNNNNKW